MDHEPASPSLDAPPESTARAQLDPHLGEAPRDAATAAAQEEPDPAVVHEIPSARAGGGPLPRKDFFSDRTDRSLFLVFAGMGLAIVAILKLGLDIYTLWTAVPPVAILTLYAVVVHRQQYFRLHPDRLGDNCYYMGFIFTLASLSFALMQLENTVAAARGSLLDSLIGNFGIALFSTIAGIALRVYFIQFRREVEDEEEQIRQDLQAVATQLKDQLSLAVLDLEGFRVRTGQVLEERMINAAGEFARVQQGMALEAGGAAQKFAAFQADLAVRAEAVANAMISSANNLTGNADRIFQEMHQLIGRIQKIETPPDLLSRHLRQAQTRISQLGTALERITANEAKRSDAFEKATDGLLKQLAVLTNTSNFTQLHGATEQLQQRMNTLGAEIATLTAGMARYQQAISQLALGATQEQAALAAIRETLEQNARNSAEALGALEGTLSDIARGVAARLANTHKLRGRMSVQPIGQTSFRLASDRDYRRGVILGLTLAEILLLLVFLLLLAAGAILARVQDQAARQAARVTELQSQLQPVIDALKKSGHPVSDIDNLAALIRRGQEADTLRSQLDEMRSALAAAENGRRQNQRALDQAQRELAAARLETAKSASISSKANDYDKMVASLQNLPGGVGMHPYQDLMNRLGQYRQAMQELARLKGNGSGLPYCWVTPTGQPIYMLRFELRDDGFLVHEEQPRPRPDDPAWALLAKLPRETVIPEDDLAALAAPIATDADQRKCRYAVDVLDRTRATNKQGYRHLNYLLDLVFKRHEINEW